MPHPSLRWLWFWSLVGVVCLLGVFLRNYIPVHGLYDINGHVIGRDFVNIWMASTLLREGAIATAYDLHAYIAAMREIFGMPEIFGRNYPYHNWSYPPSILAFIYPFSMVPYGWSLLIWTALGLAAYFSVCRAKNIPYTVCIPLFLLLAPSSLVNILSGQNGFFTAACFIGGFALLNKRPLLAGILFGLLTLKPQLGFIIPLALILLGRWRTFTVAALTALSLIGISLIFWDIELWQRYFDTVLPYQYELLQVFKGFYVAMLPGTYAAARLAGLPETGALIVHGIVAVDAAAAALIIFRREAASPRAILGLTIAAVLITPYAYNYDLTAVTGALLMYLLTLTHISTAERILYGLVWIIPTAIYSIMFAHLPIVPLPLIGLLGFLTFRSVFPRNDGIRIVPFSAENAPYFDSLNREWITKLFHVEPLDDLLLTNPQSIILDKEGEIWFAETSEGKIVGTYALLKCDATTYEFSKLGVAKEARGRGISRTLLHHCINRARVRGGTTLRIFTNSTLTTACNLYRQENFRDMQVSDADRARYERADTFLTYQL